MLRQESEISTLLQTCRRVPQPQPLTLEAEGVQFRKYLEENRRRELKQLEEDEKIWRRRERYDRAADPTWRARLLEQSQRTSQLFRAAVLSVKQKERDDYHDHEVMSHVHEVPLMSHVHEGPSHSSGCAGPSAGGGSPPLTGSAVLRPSTALAHSIPRPSTMRNRRGPKVGRMRARSVQEPPGATHYSTTPVTTMFLEKQKAEKPYAVAHAQRDLLSIGVIETKVKELFVGTTAIANVIALCEEAATVSEAVVACTLGGQQGDCDDEHKRTPLEGMSVLPYGREVQRVAAAMHSESQRRSFVAFDRLQAAKRAAKYQLERSMNDEFSQLYRDVESIVHR